MELGGLDRRQLQQCRHKVIEWQWKEGWWNIYLRGMIKGKNGRTCWQIWCRCDDEIWSDLRTPVLEAWQISDFIALKRTLGKESLLVSLSLFFLFIKGRCIKKIWWRRSDHRISYNTIFIWNIRLEGTKSYMKSSFMNHKDR